jgi:thioredoxin reductase
MPRRVTVIGAGPAGIAAAAGAIERGFDVLVIEKGDVGQSLKSWGETRFFTPLHMNLSPAMRHLLGRNIPDENALLTGREMTDQVLRPLSENDALRGRIQTRTRVTAVGRRGLTRADYAGHPLRLERPFRLLTERDGRESVLETDVILDATGGYATPNPIGAGGLPAPGERSLRQRPIRTLGSLHDQRDDLRGKRILLVGDGHSSANALGILETLASDPSTRVIWVVRTLRRRPCEEVANDPLPERHRVVAHANDLAEEPPPFLRVERRAMVDAFAERDGSIDVTVSGGRLLSCDRIAAFTGFHPNGGMHSELNVEISPVTEGGARLFRAISNVTDCLAVPQVGPADLASGEPDFWLIGSRSYGRAPTFLLQTGFQQIETILDSIPR